VIGDFVTEGRSMKLSRQPFAVGAKLSKFCHGISNSLNTVSSKNVFLRKKIGSFDH